jgi:hypothetical protein
VLLSREHAGMTPLNAAALASFKNRRLVNSLRCLDCTAVNRNRRDSRRMSYSSVI